MKKPIITLSEWADDFSRAVSEEIYKTLENIEGSKRGMLQEKLPLAFLTRFIALTVFKTLRDRPEHIKTSKEAYDYAYKNFNSVKNGISLAVAEGFNAAMSEFSGKDIDYMCTIKIMPEPLNSKPC